MNASGIFGPKSFLDHAVEDYDTCLNLDHGSFFITQAMAKSMVENRSGSIVKGVRVGQKDGKDHPFFCMLHTKGGTPCAHTTFAMRLTDESIWANAVSTSRRTDPRP